MTKPFPISVERASAQASFRRTLDAALADLRRVRDQIEAIRRELADAEGIRSELRHTVATLSRHLDAKDRAHVLAQLGDEGHQSAAVQRSGPVYNNVVRLIDQAPPGTHLRPSEVQKVLVDQGVPSDAKQVANVLDYLRRTRRLRRVARGQYVVDGIGLVTDTEVDGTGRADHRVSEHDA